MKEDNSMLKYSLKMRLKSIPEERREAARERIYKEILADKNKISALSYTRNIWSYTIPVLSILLVLSVSLFFLLKPGVHSTEEADPGLTFSALPAPPAGSISTLEGIRYGLLPDTSALYAVEEDRIIFKLVKGGIFLSTDKSMLSTASYRLSTPDLEITPLGTSFQAETGQVRTVISLLEGSLKVSGRYSVVLSAGEKLDGQVAVMSTAEKSKLEELYRRAWGTPDYKAAGADIQMDETAEKQVFIPQQLIITRDGQKIRGVVISETAGQLVIRTSDKEMILDKSSIERVKELD